MTVDEIRTLLAQGRRLSDEAVLRGVENLAGEHLGRLNEDLVADQLPRCLSRAKLIRKQVAAGSPAAAAKADLRLLKAQVAYAAAPREGGSRATREFKELIDAVLNPLLAGDRLDGLDDLVVFLESLYAYGYFHYHLGRARRRSELRRKRREEDGKPARPERGDRPAGGERPERAARPEGVGPRPEGGGPRPEGRRRRRHGPRPAQAEGAAPAAGTEGAPQTPPAGEPSAPPAPVPPTPSSPPPASAGEPPPA